MVDILFLEDDKLLAQSVIEIFRNASYSFDWVKEGDEAADSAYDTKYKLYLFDVNVPGINGFDLLKFLRDNGDTTPTLFLTSRNQIEDLEHGFKVGADDYIRKPFDLHELLIRIESKMPKTQEQHFSENFSIDAPNLTICCNGIAKKIPSKEFALLTYLCNHQNNFLVPEEVIGMLYKEKRISIATFRTYIKNLKRHLDGCAVIENLKGVGYCFKIV